jgi:GH24 family phage-related lysozyme (muramidase)
MGHRWYDPSTGRFLEQDPIGESGGLNLYAYVGSAPTMYVDPLGLKAESPVSDCYEVMRLAESAFNRFMPDQAGLRKIADSWTAFDPVKLLPKGSTRLWPNRGLHSAHPLSDPNSWIPPDPAWILRAIEKNLEKDDKFHFPTPFGIVSIRFRLSAKAIELLKSVEELRLRPYDDDTGGELTEWRSDATIGYGHRIMDEAEFQDYEDGITTEEADNLFLQDAAEHEAGVSRSVVIPPTQEEFDALVMLSFNIGSNAFAASSVVKLINDPNAETGFDSLEDA